MLASWIVKPSQSPYFSHVLLVKKKDGSWRFCVDYRALNALTIMDRFFILTIDELLMNYMGLTISLSLIYELVVIRFVALTDDHKAAFCTHKPL